MTGVETNADYHDNAEYNSMGHDEAATGCTAPETDSRSVRRHKEKERKKGHPSLLSFFGIRVVSMPEKSS